MNRPAPLALLLLAACATQTNRVAAGPDRFRPLEVSVPSSEHGVAFWVNQPAYVAMFEISPHRGVQLLYPRFEGERLRAARSGFSYLGSVRSSSTYRGSFFDASYVPGRERFEVRYLFVIASRAPLNMSSVTRYRSDLEFQQRAAFGASALATMRSLIDEVLPSQPDDDWATATYVVFNEPRAPGGFENYYQLVYCSNGVVYIVPLTQRRFVCPGAAVDSVRAPLDTLKIPRDTVAPDSAGQVRGKYLQAFRRKNEVAVLDSAQGLQALRVFSRPAAVVTRPQLDRQTSQSWGGQGSGEPLRPRPGGGGGSGDYAGGSQTYQPQPAMQPQTLQPMDPSPPPQPPAQPQPQSGEHAAGGAGGNQSDKPPQ